MTDILPSALAPSSPSEVPPRMPPEPLVVDEIAGRREVVGDALFLFGAGAVEQPHQQEEGHHRGHEVGIGDLPGAAMVAAADHLLDLLDDDRLFAADGHRA
jgi:hypothetical protein